MRRTLLYFRRLISGSIIVLLSTALSFPQTPSDRLAEANKLYQSGDFSGAAAIYQKLYDTGYRSEELLYNTGNAFFKSGDLAKAILFYERARLVSPADEDLNYNLEIARSRITDRFDEIPQLFFVRWFDFLSLLVPTNTWSLAALAMFVLSLLFLIVFLTKRRSGGRLTAFWLSVTTLAFSLMTVILSLRNNSLVNNSDRAVVICDIITGRSAPGESSNELFVIHSGAVLRIEESLGAFTEVRLPDGNKGWVKSDCIEEI